MGTAVRSLVTNFSAHLSMLLTVERKPMTLDDRAPFRALFSTYQPPAVTWRGSRQIGKTHTIAAKLILRMAEVPGHKTLVLLPLQEHSDRMSGLIYKPMVEDSPIRAILGVKTAIGSVRRIHCDNGSLTHFSYCYGDPTRVRQISCSWIYFDEAQDLDPNDIPVIREVLSSKEEEVIINSGTSKSKQTYLEQRWEKSSQGIWTIKCTACGRDNRLCLDDGDVLETINPDASKVCEKTPGIWCRGCKAAINPRLGRWVHRYPERCRDHVGYHAPQSAFPFHACDPSKWAIFLSKQAGEGGYTTAKFYNEVLGEAYDMAYKLVSQDDLKAVAKGIGPNDLAHAIRRSTLYPMVVVGVDWGGCGVDGVSRTKLAAVGIQPNGTAEVFFGAQFQPSTDSLAEGREVLRLAALLNATLLAHDYNGAVAREHIINSLGWPVQRLVPMVYRQVIGGEMIEFQKPMKARTRGYYVMDKGRTLQFLCMAIRARRITFFDYDYRDENSPGLLNDFTALVEDRIETPTGGGYRVRKLHESMTDDFAHAVNFACAAGWEMTNGWPDLSRAGTVSGR